MLHAMREAQTEPEKAHSNLESDGIKFLDWNNLGTNHNRTSRFFLFVRPHNLEHWVESQGWCDLAVIIMMVRATVLWSNYGLDVGPDWPRPQNPLDKERTQTILNHGDLSSPQNTYCGKKRRLAAQAQIKHYIAPPDTNHTGTLSIWYDGRK